MSPTTSRKNREPVDMSPAALAARLEEIRALYQLMIWLRQARPIGPAVQS